ncbi:MAG: hypothetical protein IPL27_10270 [Lewinellaceae bacterium]|nr:hypothetical protein [Lewinellaceae bacterium]
MKNLLFFSILFSGILLFSCKQNSSGTLSTEQMQKQLDASPNVAKYREAFQAHTVALMSFTPAELQTIHTQMRECGLFPSGASQSDLEKCLAGIPKSAQYVEADKFMKECDELEKNGFLNFSAIRRCKNKRSSL